LIAIGRNALESGELGQHNGLPTSIIIRTTLQDLESRAGVGVTGGGTVMPIKDVIRLAGHANHYLAIFDKASGLALDLFSSRRLAGSTNWRWPADRTIDLSTRKAAGPPPSTPTVRSSGYPRRIWTPARHGSTTTTVRRASFDG
jgi:hypothetical protein